MGIYVMDIPAKLWMLKQDYTNSSTDEFSDSELSTLLEMTRSMAGASSEALYCVFEQGTANCHKGKCQTIPLTG